MNGGALRWSLGSLAGHSSGTIYLNVQVAPNATGSVANTGRITTTTPGDDADDNTSTTTTQIATPPKPEADIKLRIHSTFDPLRGIYTSDGAAVSWPAGETMDFTPYAALKPVPVGQPGLYRYKQRVVGWSLIAISGASVDLPDSMGRSGCRSRATPTEDVGTVQGCTYKYLLNPSPTDMRSQAHIFWSVKRPQSKPENTYVYVGQPLKSATLTIDVVIVTEIVDDQPGSPTYGVALYATTDTERGVFDVTLLVPRSTK